MKNEFKPDIFRFGDATLVVPNNAEYEDTMLKLNETAVQILDMLTAGLSEEEITGALTEKYDADAVFIAGSVKDCIRQLGELGVIKQNEGK